MKKFLAFALLMPCVSLYAAEECCVKAEMPTCMRTFDAAQLPAADVVAMVKAQIAALVENDLLDVVRAEELLGLLDLDLELADGELLESIIEEISGILPLPAPVTDVVEGVLDVVEDLPVAGGLLSGLLK